MAYSQAYLHRTKRLDPAVLEALADPKRCGFNRSTAAGKRDWLVVQTIRTTGMRCVELNRLRVDNLTKQPDGSLLVRFTGKGRRERLAIIRNGLAAALARYVRGRKPDAPVFPALDSHGAPTGEPISTAAVWHIVRKVGARIGVPDLGPHRMRHTWISEAIDAGLPLGQVMSMAGHSALATTQRYYHASPARLAEAYGALPDCLG